MKKLSALVIVGLLTASPLTHAGSWWDWFNPGGGGGSSSAAGVPELDAGAAGLGLGLIVLSCALIRERKNDDE